MPIQQMLLGGTMVNTLVDIRAEDIEGSGAPSGSASAGLMFRPNGTVYRFAPVGGIGGWASAGYNWLVVGAASDYEIQMVHQVGSFTTNPASGQYVSMANTRLFNKTATQVQDREVWGIATVRLTTDASTIAVGSVHLHAIGGDV